MVVKHRNPKGMGGLGGVLGGGGGRREESHVIWRRKKKNLLSNLSVVVLLCWLGTMKPHVEDVFTPLHLRVAGCGREGRSGREDRRQERRWETAGRAGDKVCVCVSVCVYIVERKNGDGITERRPKKTKEEKGNKLWKEKEKKIEKEAGIKNDNIKRVEGEKKG